MKIDEAGLVALVNKFIREKITKEEQRDPNHKVLAPTENPSESNEVITLFNKEEQHERALVRCLLDFGHLPFNEEESVAAYILRELQINDINLIPTLNSIVQCYIQWLEEGLAPQTKNFLYHENPEISSVAVSLQEFKHEISPRWKEEPHELAIPTRDDLYREEIDSVMTYFKLRKIKILIEQNQRDLEQPCDEDVLKDYLATHKELKEIEMALTRKLGSVIIK